MIMKKTPFHLDKEHLVHINFKPFLLLLFLFIGVWGYGQDILFQENFEAATGAQNLTNPAYLNWQGAQFTQQTNDNYFWILDNSRCSVISGQHSLAVSRNSPATNGTASYNNSSKAQTLAYYTTPIDATNYTNVTLDFNWYCSGEVSRDFGKVAYSLDGNTWTILPSEYAGQPTAQNVVDLDLSVLDGQQFYIGFAWENDNRLGSNPSFVVDDIVIKGITIAPPPSNDTCSGAISLTPSANNTCNATTGTTVGATQSLPGCTGDADDDVWYSFVATHTNHDILVTTPGSIVNGINDIVFQVYSSSGTCALTSLGCKDDTGGSNNETASLTGATIGNTYYIRVFSYDGNGNEGTFDICITTPTITSCIPSISEAYHPPTNYIREISFVGTLEDVTNTSTFSNSTPRGYQDFTGLATKARQAQGEGVNIYVDSPNRGFYKAWVDWNNDGVFSPDERFYNVSTAVFNTTFGFVIPPTTPPGDYKIRIRMNSNGGNFGPCGNLDYYGETEDYLFTVEPYCDATITSVTDGETCGESTVDLTVTGSAGTTEYRWYTTENGGTPIATTTTGNWTTPEINTTTSYYITAYNGSCESWVRTEITATFNPVPTVIFNPAAPMVCGEDEIIQLTAEGDTEKVYLIDENFEGGGLGVFTNINLVDNQNNITEWQNKTSTFVPNQETWYPAISSGFGPNKFVMATSDVGTSPTHNQIMSPSVNSTDFLNLTLELRMYFSRYRLNDVDPENEYVTIEASRDDGTNWDEIERIVRDVGIGTRFEKLEFDLSAYINEPSLRVRVRYFSTWADGVAIDDIKLYGEKPLNTAFVYDPTTVDAFTDAAATTPYASGTPITSIYIRPTLEQLENETFEIPVSTTLFNGCEATGTAIVTNNTKIFKSPQNDWYDDDNWSPAGVPTIDNCVIIPNNQTSIVDGTLLHAEAKNVTVKNVGFL